MAISKRLASLMGGDIGVESLPGNQKLPILVMTANAFDEDRLACIEAGINDHIFKSADPDKSFET